MNRALYFIYSFIYYAMLSKACAILSNLALKIDFTETKLFIQMASSYSIGYLEHMGQQNFLIYSFR